MNGFDIIYSHFAEQKPTDRARNAKQAIAERERAIRKWERKELNERKV